MRLLRQFVICQDSNDATVIDKATIIDKTDGAGQTGGGPVEALVASAGLMGNSAPDVESITNRMATLSVTCGST